MTAGVFKAGKASFAVFLFKQVLDTKKSIWATILQWIKTLQLQLFRQVSQSEQGEPE